jgi:Leucine-rich repeat (LRR) protein
VYFTFGNIQEIRSNTFLNAAKLRNLFLSYNNISTLDADTFKGAQNLYHLDLSYNHLSSVDANAFRGLSKLQYLYLQYTKLTTLYSQTFAPLNSLVYLNLENNQISSLDITFVNATNLQYLYLTHNTIFTLRADPFKGAQNLNYLVLSYNQLTSIDANAFRGLSKLTNLYLGNIKVATLNSQTFATLDSLQHLDLSNNQDIFRNLTNLVSFNMEYNSLQTLDPTIFLNNLKLLYLSLRNTITTLSSKMFQPFYNTSLIMDLNNNVCINQPFDGLLNETQQRALESALETCNKTIYEKVLNCAGLASSPSKCSFNNQVLGTNDTATFTVSSGLTPTNINSVYFNSNLANSVSFYYIPASLFTYFPNLLFTNLSYGNIQEIRSNTFFNAAKLQYLILSQNNISLLGADALKVHGNYFISI